MADVDGIDVIKFAVEAGIRLWLQTRIAEIRSNMSDLDNDVKAGVLETLLDELLDCSNIAEFPWDAIAREQRLEEPEVKLARPAFLDALDEIEDPSYYDIPNSR